MAVVMKKYLIIAAAALCALTACHQVEFIESSADRQGLTSLTAIFTSGPYVDQELAKLVITDDTQTDFVIPIPWFYPETSNDQTTEYMDRLRVKAELQPNFKISPPITILDLTDMNYFTITDPAGKSREICITGKRVKSAECRLLSFGVVEPFAVGVPYDDKNELLIATKDDLSSAKATFQVSAHATVDIEEDEARNFNEGETVTVTAHDGKTKKVYTIVHGDPIKIDRGIEESSLAKLFNIDPVSMLGLAKNDALYNVSLAFCQDKLVINCGDGSTPIYLNALNGVKEGTLNVGSAPLDAITSDEAGNILFSCMAGGGAEPETETLYLSTSLSGDPVPFSSFPNPAMMPIGHKIKVYGNLTGNAQIVLPAEGIANVSAASEVVVIDVIGGVAGEPRVVDFAAYGHDWGQAPVNVAGICPAGPNVASDGFFLHYYEGSHINSLDGTGDTDYLLHHIAGNGKDTVIDGMGNWANNPNCVDCKEFNHSRYMALFVVSHFPEWSIPSMLYVYDANTPNDPTCIFARESIELYETGVSGVAAGDVIIGISTDGYYVYVYYFDHNTQCIGGYKADCIFRG